MVSSSFTSPSYSRVPGLMDRLEELRNRPDLLRQLALLVVVAAAGALLLVLPEPSNDPVTIAALSDDEADETTNELDGEEASGPSADESANGWLGRDNDSSDTDVERFAMIAGFGAAANSAADLAVGSSSSTSSTAPPTTAATTTAPSTTAAPTTEAPASEAPATDGDTTAEAGTEAPDTDQATETGVDVDESESDGTADSAESDSTSETVDGESVESAPAEEATTTTTAPPTTVAADNGFVDAGHGVMVPPILLKIRFCESTDNYTAANPASSARGAYQFLTGSWAAYGHADRYGVSQAHLASPAQQDEAALITWQADGTRPWLASKHCWG